MNLILKLKINELVDLLVKQLNSNFLVDKKEKKIVKYAIEDALGRLDICFKANKNKYYSYNGKPIFNPFHSGQYTIFLYYLSNVLYTKYENENFAAKVYYLNKTLNSVDLFYAIKLPSVFGIEHPIGAVMGRAQYSDFFWFYQHTTVGGNKNKYPVLGENIVLYANATVLGDSKIGSNCLISANTYIKDEDVPSNSIVYGSSPNLIIKKNKSVMIENIIKEIFLLK